jgi:hypothetical protein
MTIIESLRIDESPKRNTTKRAPLAAPSRGRIRSYISDLLEIRLGSTLRRLGPRVVGPNPDSRVSREGDLGLFGSSPGRMRAGNVSATVLA